MERLIEEIRNGTLQLRMVPIGETFSRFRRVVRDVAADLHKDVVLEIQGGETELDKSMVERIADPLMHLVRNALESGASTVSLRTRAEYNVLIGDVPLDPAVRTSVQQRQLLMEAMPGSAAAVALAAAAGKLLPP